MYDVLNKIYSAEYEYIMYNRNHIQSTKYSIDVKR